MTSAAGSPTASAPKSSTPLSRPSVASRFRASRSPWIQTGGPDHGRRAERRLPLAFDPARYRWRLPASRWTHASPRRVWRAARLAHRAAVPVDVDRPQFVDEPRRGPRPPRVDPEVLRCGDVTRQPRAHGPAPGVPLARLPQRERHRYRERQMRSQPWQPLVLFERLGDRPVDPRQADRTCPLPAGRSRCPSRQARLAAGGAPPTRGNCLAISRDTRLASMSISPACIVTEERVRGIEPPFQAWEACVLPLNHTRVVQPLLAAEAQSSEPRPGRAPEPAASLADL